MMASTSRADHRLLVIVISLLVVASTGSSATADSPRAVKPDDAAESKVTTLSDPDQWRFTGCQTFRADELRDVLGTDLEIIAATRVPAADVLQGAIARRLMLGYQQCGFPQAKVTVDVDETVGELAIAIDEGRQVLQGQVEVRGAAAIDIQRLVTEVQSPQPPDGAIPIANRHPVGDELPLDWVTPKGDIVRSLGAAVWVPGQPASFAPKAWKGAEPKVRQILSRMGFAQSKLALSIEMADDSTARLVIDIQQEGPRTVLGEIEVVGNERNSAESVIRYLGLKSGMSFDITQQGIVQRRLRQSARFLKHTVELMPAWFDGTSHLKLTVVEAPGIPTLDEPLTPVQQIVVRAAEWIETQREFDWELKMTDPDSELPVPQAAQELFRGRPRAVRQVTSPTDGVLFEVLLADKDERPVWGQIASVGPDGAWLLSPHRNVRLESSRFDGTAQIGFSCEAHPPDRTGSMSTESCGFQIGWTKASRQRASGFLLVSPMALVVETLKPDRTFKLTDEFLTITGKGVRLEIENKSGRIVLWDGEDREIRFQRGLLAAARERWRPEREAATQALEAGRPLSSLLLHGTQEARYVAALKSATLPPALRVAERLVQAGALRKLDEAVNELHQKKAGPFSIPSVWDVSNGPPNSTGSLAAVALPWYAKGFPRGTPGWTIGRELALTLAQSKAIPVTTPAQVCRMLDND